MGIEIQHFYDPATFTLSYLVYDPDSKDAILIDPVLDYNPGSGKVSFESLDKIEAVIKERKLKLHYSLDTHAHADHLSASYYVKRRFPNAKIGIGKDIVKVQEIFKKIFNLEDLKTDGSQFDLLLGDGETLQAGTLSLKAYHTPGHTPACMGYKVEDALFVGDTIFMPDFGAARADFPGGSAKDLYSSVQKIYELSDDTRIFVGHDYQPGGRELKFETTIREQKEKNVQIPAHRDEEDFVEKRSKRDKELDAPKLLLPSIQVNINGGKLPEPESNGTSYLKIPLKVEQDF